MSINQDPARLIAERVSRRLAADATSPESRPPTIGNGTQRPPENRRARIIDFISATPPARTQSSFGSQQQMKIDSPPSANPYVPQVAQSPWLAPFATNSGTTVRSQSPSQIASHPSEERFGVEEAAVSELVEFFENEKQCSVDPSGKPCDHCAMCSSRGF